ncbi:hypothetical protein NQD34_011523 [Periophthalmus magnuspinnatus]|nr:hypothetical protein NQD34_011523 [Periophthalmus magnuspinnatus]
MPAVRLKKEEKGGVRGGCGGGLSDGFKEILANRLTPQEEEQCFTNTVYSAGGELLTSTGDTAGRWKEHSEDLLNPTVQQRQRCSVCSDAVAVLVCRGKGGAELKPKTLDLPSIYVSAITYGHELWVMTEGQDRG